MKKQRKKAAKVNISPKVLAEKAQGHLEARRFKEAIAHFKQLIAATPGAGWEAGLGQAYWGRAEELAGKGMYKEAIPLLEDSCRLRNEDVPLDRLLPWLIGARRHSEAARLILAEGEGVRSLPRDLRESLEAFLAAQVVAGNAEILEAAAEDSPFRRQGEAARDALAACAAGDDERLDSLLGQLSLRGPFKALRLLLKALSLAKDDPAGAEGLLAKIPLQSPFAGAARAIHACLAAEGPSLTDLMDLDPGGRRFVAAVRKLDLEAVHFLGRWSMGEETGCRHISLLAEMKDRCPTPTLRQAALDLLLHNEKCIKAFEKGFGALSEFEKARLKALREEAEGNPSLAMAAWGRVFRLMDNEPAGSDTDLRRALVLRHMAKLETRYNGFAEGQGYILLEKSLEYDPDDRDTYLELIKYFRAVSQDADRHRWADIAAKRFPDDREILGEAVTAALDKQAFKKAARYAEKILKQDPINSKVRGQIVDAHLAHARRSLGKGRPDLARKEYASAHAMERPEARSGLVEIALGLLEIQQGDEKAGGALIQEGRKLRGTEIESGFHVLLEAGRQGMANKWREKFEQSYSRDCRKAEARREEIQALIASADGLPEKEDALVGGILAKAESYLKKCAALPLSIEEVLTMCRLLFRLDQNATLKAFAETGLQHWPDEIAFSFYRTYGKCDGDLARLNAREQILLNRLVDQAEEKGDFDLLNQIDDWINPFSFRMASPFCGGGSPFGRGDPFGDDDLDDLGQDMVPDDPSAPISPEQLLDIITVKFLELVELHGREKAKKLIIEDFPIPIPVSEQRKLSRLLDDFLEAHQGEADPEPAPNPAPARKTKGRRRSSPDEDSGQGELF